MRNSFRLMGIGLGTLATLSASLLLADTTNAEPKEQVLVIELDWHGGILTDRASLQVVNEFGNSFFRLGIPGFSDDRDVVGKEDDSLTLMVKEGEMIEVSQIPYETNVGSYDIGLHCDGPEMVMSESKVDATGAMRASYLVPTFANASSDTPIVCTFTNTMLYEDMELTLNDTDLQQQLAADFDSGFAETQITMNDLSQDDFELHSNQNSETSFWVN
jgi:hypothetical protein